MYSNAGPWQGMDPASDALQYRRADFRITPAVVQMVIIPIFGNPAKTGYAASPPTTPAMDHPESSHPRGLASTAYGEPTSSCHRLTVATTFPSECSPCSLIPRVFSTEKRNHGSYTIHIVAFR